MKLIKEQQYESGWLKVDSCKECGWVPHNTTRFQQRFCCPQCGSEELENVVGKYHYTSSTFLGWEFCDHTDHFEYRNKRDGKTMIFKFSDRILVSR